MSKKKDECMEEQPGWYNGQFLDEVGFCCDFICRHPMVCVGGKFFSKEGRIHDENGIKKEIYEMLRPLYYRVVVFSVPLQGHMLHCKGCCGLVIASYRKTVPERLQPQPFTVLLIS